MQWTRETRALVKGGRGAVQTERNQEIYRLAAAGHQIAVIAKKFELSTSRVAEIVMSQRAKYESTVRVTEIRLDVLNQLNQMRADAQDIIDSGGTVLLDKLGNPMVDPEWENDDGSPIYLKDSSSVINAMRTIVMIDKRIADMYGMDAPQKIQTNGNLTYDITGVDVSKLRP